MFKERVTEWIKQHQVVTFFILSFVITWPGLFLCYFILPGNQLVEALCAPVAFGPALAAMLISSIVEPSPKVGSRKAGWICFIFSWIFSTAVQVLYFSQVLRTNLTVPILFISCYWGVLPAWVLSSVFSHTPGIRRQFSTILKPRGPFIWYLVVFIIFPGFLLLSFWVTRLLGGEAKYSLEYFGVKSTTILVSLDFLRGFLTTGGINEESGWRGFALPRLQARYPVIISAIIVWFFWAVWHLPYDFGRGEPIAWILETRIFWNLVMAIIMTWLYNRTNGSILAPALFHAAMNTFGNLFSQTTLSRILLVGLVVFIILYERMWKKLPADSQAVAKSTRSN